jgi:DNA helicase TIP49 (TBP-interacting protein)
MMANEQVAQDNEPIEYALQSIEVVSKSMTERPAQAGPLFFFEVNITTRVKAEDKVVIPLVNIKIKEGNTNQLLAEIVVGVIFVVIEFDKYIVLNSEGLYVIPQILEQTINPISISTARGVMFCEFRGSYLHNAILPVIAINQRQAITKEEYEHKNREALKRKELSRKK